MWLLANLDGVVSSITTIEVPGSVFYADPIPSDFENTFALGKYVFLNGVISEVPGWTPPAPAPQQAV